MAALYHWLPLHTGSVQVLSELLNVCPPTQTVLGSHSPVSPLYHWSTVHTGGVYGGLLGGASWLCGAATLPSVEL